LPILISESCLQTKIAFENDWWALHLSTDAQCSLNAAALLCPLAGSLLPRLLVPGWPTSNHRWSATRVCSHRWPTNRSDVGQLYCQHFF
jgi:hypothetical protein